MLPPPVGVSAGKGGSEKEKKRGKSRGQGLFSSIKKVVVGTSRKKKQQAAEQAQADAASVVAMTAGPALGRRSGSPRNSASTGGAGEAVGAGRSGPVSLFVV